VERPGKTRVSFFAFGAVALGRAMRFMTHSLIFPCKFPARFVKTSVYAGFAMEFFFTGKNSLINSLRRERGLRAVEMSCSTWNNSGFRLAATGLRLKSKCEILAALTQLLCGKLEAGSRWPLSSKIELSRLLHLL
jgi:hypothetical protein